MTVKYCCIISLLNIAGNPSVASYFLHYLSVQLPAFDISFVLYDLGARKQSKLGFRYLHFGSFVYCVIHEI